MWEIGRLPQKLHINPAAGLMSAMAMPRSLRPKPDARAPGDEEAVLPQVEMLRREAPLRRAAPNERSSTAPRSSYRPPSVWARLARFTSPRRALDAWRIARLYRDLRPFDKMDYLKHYEDEPKEVPATHGLELVDISARTRRGL